MHIVFPNLGLTGYEAVLFYAILRYSKYFCTQGGGTEVTWRVSNARNVPTEASPSCQNLASLGALVCCNIIPSFITQQNNKYVSS